MPADARSVAKQNPGSLGDGQNIVQKEESLDDMQLTFKTKDIDNPLVFIADTLGTARSKTLTGFGAEDQNASRCTAG